MNYLIILGDDIEFRVDSLQGLLSAISDVVNVALYRGDDAPCDVLLDILKR